MRSAHHIMQRTCSLCLRELAVDHISRLDQGSAGLDHLEDKEYMKSVIPESRTS